jgi:AraC-like DNA-binding protein
MVCQRCIQSVKQLLDELSLEPAEITLGAVVLAKEINLEQRNVFADKLKEQGFELLDDRNTQLINQIKSIIIDEIHHSKEALLQNFSTVLSERLHYDYSYLSRLFSSVEGRTIEKFILAQKIEKVKELLSYNELTLSEIALEMHYSSTSHLSAQFKKITGMSPSEFKKLQEHNRQSLDTL